MSDFRDQTRRPNFKLDPTDYMTSHTGIIFHVLDEYEDALFLPNSRCQFSIWRLGINTGSTILVKTEEIGVECTYEEETKKRFKEHVQRLFDEYVDSIRGMLQGPMMHHIVISEPVKSASFADADGEGLTHTMNAVLGFFSVQRGVAVRLYGRSVTFSSLAANTVGDAFVGKNASEEAEAVIGPTLIGVAIERERKALTNEILGFAVDLLKAGSGHYEGEAAQTIRNLVGSRLKEILVVTPELLNSGTRKMWQAVFLTKALVKMVGLGKFVLAEDKHEYFGKRAVEKIRQMKADRGISGRGDSKVNIVRIGDLERVVARIPVSNTHRKAVPPLPNDNKGDLRVEANKARAKIRAKRAEDIEAFAEMVPPDSSQEVEFDFSGVGEPTQFEKEGGDVSSLWRTEPDISNLDKPNLMVERPDGL